MRFPTAQGAPDFSKVCVADRAAVGRKLAALISGGAAQLSITADWDRTITTGKSSYVPVSLAGALRNLRGDAGAPVARRRLRAA